MKTLSVLYLDIYNDKILKNKTFSERLNGVLQYFREHNVCNINLDKYISLIKNYKLSRIKVKILDNNDKYIYDYTIHYTINDNETKETNIKADILKSNIIFKVIGNQ